jgi:hypothetical protein
MILKFRVKFQSRRDEAGEPLAFKTAENSLDYGKMQSQQKASDCWGNNGWTGSRIITEVKVLIM